MDRKTAKAIAADMKKALEKVGTKYGGTFLYKGGKFIIEDGTFAPKFEFAETSSTGRSTKTESDWKYFSGMGNDLDGIELGAYFIVNNTRYKLVDCKPRSPKWPIIGEGPRGGRYKFQLRMLIDGLV